MEADPIGLKGGINPYSYVTDPLTQIDPFGLMGRASGAAGSRVQSPWPKELNDFTPCDYYRQTCDKTGCRYYCTTGPLVCRNAQAAPSWFSLYGATKLNCVRRCLVKKDAETRAAKCVGSKCLPDADIDAYHNTCFTECGVPPGAYPGVNPWWLPFNPNKH
jgi:hypothetical protein